MARWASVIEVAGVIFTGCRGVILDAEEFLSVYKGSTRWGNLGNANTQLVNVGVKGNQFGVQMETAQTSKILQVASAIASTEASLTAFAVKLTDDMYSINHYCTKDYTQRWLSYGKISEGWAEDVVMRFISRSSV